MFLCEIWGKNFTREISKFQKSELGKIIQNFPYKHVITSTNTLVKIIKNQKRNLKVSFGLMSIDSDI